MTQRSFRKYQSKMMKKESNKTDQDFELKRKLNIIKTKERKR